MNTPEMDDSLSEDELAAGAIFSALIMNGATADAVTPAPGFDERMEAFMLAKVGAAGSAPMHALPPHPDADELVADTGSLGGDTVAGASAGSETNANVHTERTVKAPAGGGKLLHISALVGWAAAAALLALVLLSKESDSVADLQPADARAAMLAGGGDVDTVVWATPAGSTLGGDVVWSDAQNEGYMRISGLDVNDPSKSQYQLWIFRGDDPVAEPHPVDGGVFDVPSSGEVIVPIDAKLNVGHAGLFAVTVEKPGGIVVSGREQIVLIAARGT